MLSILLAAAWLALAPSIIIDVALPLVLAIIVLIAARGSGHTLSDSYRQLRYIAFGCLIALAWRPLYFDEIRAAFPTFITYIGETFSYTSTHVLLTISTIAHVYIILALLCILAKMRRIRAPELLRGRQFSILLASITIFAALAAVIRFAGFLGAAFVPDIDFQIAGALFAVLVFIPRSPTSSIAAEPAAGIRSTVGSVPADPIVIEPEKPAEDITSSEATAVLERAPKMSDDQSAHAVPATIAQGQPALDLSKPTATRRMQLKLRRAQRGTLTGKVIFTLDAQMDVPAEDSQLVNKYRLGGLVIYDSAERQKHTGASQSHLESTKDMPGLTEDMNSQLRGTGKMLYRFARAGVSAAMAGLSLRVTVASLTKGVHVECKSMEELLAAERAIIEAAETLRGYIDTAETFDGREVVLEF